MRASAMMNTMNAKWLANKNSLFNYLIAMHLYMATEKCGEIATLLKTINYAAISRLLLTRLFYPPLLPLLPPSLTQILLHHQIPNPQPPCHGELEQPSKHTRFPHQICDG